MARRGRSTSRRGLRLSLTLITTLLLLTAAGAGLVFHLGQGATISSAGDDIAAGGAQQANGPFRSIENGFRRLTQMWTATDRIAELEREKQDMEIWRSLAERLAERNARYEELLRMPPDAFGEDGDYRNAIGAQLVLDSGGPFTRTLVANAGAEHGVRIGFIALNENGLVGRVVSVGQRSSRVLLLDDYNSRIPVMGAQSRVRAVMVGQAAEPPDLVTRPFEVENPRLDFFPGGLRDGEPVITSGDGGLYPRGIQVGIARRIAQDTWVVALSASQQPIDFVRIVPFERPDAPERSGEVADPGPPMVPPAASIAQAQPPPVRRPRAPPPATAPTETAPPAAEPSPPATNPAEQPTGPPT